MKTDDNGKFRRTRATTRLCVGQAAISGKKFRQRACAAGYNTVCVDTFSDKADQMCPWFCCQRGEGTVVSDD